VTDDTPCHFTRELPLGAASGSLSLHDVLDEVRSARSGGVVRV
jgi:hypothetical protein